MAAPMSETLATKPARRSLRFETLDAIIADCERLAAGPCAMLGQWSLAQIFEHLAHGIECFYNGFGFQAPWIARKLVAPLIRNRVIYKEMRAGFNLPSTATRLLPTSDPQATAALERLRRGIERMKTDPPTHPHPFLGRLTHAEVTELMKRHAELHLSFAVPAE